MIYAFYLLVPLGLGVACLLISHADEQIVAVAAAWLLAAGGLALRRFLPIVAGAVVLLAAYLTNVISLDGSVLLPQSTAFGIGLFIMLELGHDCTSVVHGKLTLKAYRIRGRFVAAVSIGTVVLVPFLTAVAYGTVVHLKNARLSAVILPAMVPVLAGIAFIVYLRTRSDMRNDIRKDSGSGE